MQCITTEKQSNQINAIIMMKQRKGLTNDPKIVRVKENLRLSETCRKTKQQRTDKSQHNTQT